MITVNLHDLRRAEAHEHRADRAFSVVHLVAGDGSYVDLLLPSGTAAAVAACINVAISAGQTAAKARWHEVCEAMNRGTWSGTEAEALAEVARCKAIVEGAAA